MYMEPIVVPDSARREASRPIALKLLAGGIFCLAAAIVMPLYWAGLALWFAAAALLLAARAVVRSGYDCLIYAGEAIVGE